MKKILYSIILVLSVCSCRKSGADEKSGPFKYNDCHYQTLSEAVAAVASSASSSDPDEIFLEADASGSGVSIAADRCMSICLNLGNHTYTLDPGATIDVANNGLYLKGEGGKIVASSGTPAVQGWDSEMIFSGDFDLLGENIVKSASDIYLESDFAGELNGNVEVDSASVVLSSNKCIVTIPVLKAVGPEAGFFAEVDKAGSSYVAKIGKVLSDQDYPVTAECRGVIFAGCNVHIHSFVKKTVPGNCVTPEQYQYVCQDCGYVKVDELGHGAYGVCDPEGFIHVAGRNATDYEFGNVEYWQCPLCGKCYSDKEYLNDVTGSLYIFPNEYWTIYKLLSEGNSPDYDTVSPLSILGFVITAAITLATSLTNLIYGKKIDLAKLSSMIDEVGKKVDEISAKVNQLLVAVRNVENKINIMNRQDDLASLLSFAQMTNKNIDSLKRKYPNVNDSLKLYEEVKVCLAEWAKYEIGTKKESPVVLTKRLLTEYNKGGVTFSKIYSDFVNRFGVWEHDGYAYRSALMATDMMSLGMSFPLTYLYTKYVKEYQAEESRKAELSKLMYMFKDIYAEDALADSAEMHNREAAYRVLLPRNLGENPKVFKRKLEGSWNFYEYAKSHSNFKLQYDNKDNMAAISLNRMMNDMGIKLDSIMNVADAEFLNEVYNRPKKEITPFVKMLISDCGFQTPTTLTDQQLDHYFFIPANDSGHHQTGGKATYKIFCWESYKTSDHDTFGLRTMSSWNNQYFWYRRALDGANIKRRNGVFSSYGHKTDNEYFVARMTK